MAKTSKNQHKIVISNHLQSMLEKEGIKQSELSKESGVSGSTINKLANNRLIVTKTTQNRLIIAINKMRNKTYSPEDIFPSNRSTRAKDMRT
jgi:transcriptional regulator with XRE-family HTH domain